jgi:hypothetical protein
MRSFAVDLNPYLGTYAAVDEINAEASDVFAALHGVDRDNLDGELITAQKCAVGAFGLITSGSRSVAQNITVSEQSAGNVPIPVPNDTGEPWAAEVTTGDGYLRGAVYVEITSFPNGGIALYLGVLLDGVLVSRAPAMRGVFDAAGDPPAVTMGCDFAVPVRAGAHRIEFVAILTRPPANGTGYAFTFENGEWFARECVR